MKNRSKQSDYEFKNRFRYWNLRGGGIEEEYRSIIKRGGSIEEEHMKAYQTAMSLICPITQELMLDPVTISTGRTFERSAIETYFRFSGTRDPTTNEPLSNRHITPSILVQTLTKQFVEFYEGKQGKEWERVVQYCNTYKTTLREEREREREQEREREREQESQRERERERERERIRRAEAINRPTTMTFDPSLISSSRRDEEESLRRARLVQEARDALRRPTRIVNSMNNQLAQVEAQRAARREERLRDETNAASRLVEHESRINGERQANNDLRRYFERR
jgi:hypothetical protein